MYLCDRSVDFVSLYEFDIWFWNSSDSMVLWGFHVAIKVCIFFRIYSTKPIKKYDIKVTDSEVDMFYLMRPEDVVILYQLRQYSII